LVLQPQRPRGQGSWIRALDLVLAEEPQRECPAPDHRAIPPINSTRVEPSRKQWGRADRELVRAVWSGAIVPRGQMAAVSATAAARRPWPATGVPATRSRIPGSIRGRGRSSPGRDADCDPTAGTCRLTTNAHPAALLRDDAEARRRRMTG